MFIHVRDYAGADDVGRRLKNAQAGRRLHQHGFTSDQRQRRLDQKGDQRGLQPAHRQAEEVQAQDCRLQRQAHI